jgi:hypothetical protein
MSPPGSVGLIGEFPHPSHAGRRLVYRARGAVSGKETYAIASRNPNLKFKFECSKSTVTQTEIARVYSMKSKELEAELAELSGRPLGDITQRFQKGRECNLLSKARGQHAGQLSLDEIARGLLCTVALHPASAGLKAAALAELRPVGGVAASFREAPTLEAAIAAAIEHSDDVLELTVLDGGFGRGSQGYAKLEYSSGLTHFVHRDDRISQHRGAEKKFNPRAYERDPFERPLVIRQAVFRRLGRRWSETLERERIEVRARELANRFVL